MLSMPMKALISALVVVGAVGLALVLERTESRSGEVKAEQLLVADLAGESGREVNIQVYTFPPGASVPWHIHPDAHEFDYELDGTLTLQTDGIEGAEARRCRLCGAERGASRGECEPHASSEALRGAGKAQGRAAHQGSAALGLVLGM